MPSALCRPVLLLSLLGAAAQATQVPGILDPPLDAVLATPTAPAFDYGFLDGSSRIGFRGTALEPRAAGEGHVRGDGGRMRIHAHFRGLGPASRFGPEYLTYVLWSVSPMGRVSNLGEVVVQHGRARVDALTHLQTFGLIVSAEPHFAVTRMSNAVALENVAPRRARPNARPVEARFALMERVSYPRDAGFVQPIDPKVSTYIHQARVALHIARMEQAETLAPFEYGRALDQLTAMEGEPAKNRDKAILAARRAVQCAEDARLVAEKKQEALRLFREREKAREADQRAEKAEAEAARMTQQVHREEHAATEARRRATEAQLNVRRKLMEQLNDLLQTQETEEGLLATVTDVAFAPGSSKLSASARVNLAKVAGILLARPGLKVKVRGHTDASGNPAFNARLSRARAEGVRQFLQAQGLPSRVLEAVGVDGQFPIAPNDTAEGRRMNRRVDLVVSGEPIGI